MNQVESISQNYVKLTGKKNVINVKCRWQKEEEEDKMNEDYSSESNITMKEEQYWSEA